MFLCHGDSPVDLVIEIGNATLELPSLRRCWFVWVMERLGCLGHLMTPFDKFGRKKTPVRVFHLTCVF